MAKRLITTCPIFLTALFAVVPMSYSADDGLITAARLFRPYEAPYGRIEVLDAHGNKAWSNPLWIA